MKVFFEYIKKYKITYISTIIVFIIGILIGLVFVFKISDNEKNEVREYITTSINDCKEHGIDNYNLFKKSIIENIKFIGILYFLGCTIIAGFVVYIAILYKGFIFGYTGFSVIMALKIKNGIKYLFPILILHNIVYLPIVFLLATSGIRMYKEIMRKTINIKIELLKHSIIMLICIIFSIISSGVEAYFSPMIFEIL